MADVFRPSYQTPCPSDAHLFTKKGVRMARFRLTKSDRMVEGRVMSNGKVSVQTELYYARIRRNGKVVRVALGVTDLESAKQLRSKLQLDAEHQRSGMIDPLAEHRGTPLLRHIDDYETHLVAAGRSPKHVGETTRLVRLICKACGFKMPDDLNATPLNSYLAGRIKKGRSFRTRNKSLEVMRQLVHWMQNNGRIEADPFRTVVLLNEKGDPSRRIRRPLHPEEFARLLIAAKNGKSVRGVTGEERALIYLVAATSGCRRSELAHLRVRDIILDEELPYIALPATIAKGTRDDAIPLHPVVAERLRAWLLYRDAAPNTLLFHLLSEGGTVRQTDVMMRVDCKAAGIPYTKPDGICDFHAHRTSFISNLCRLTDQFLATKLARHTDPTITAHHYDKIGMAARAKVVALLPAPKQM